VLSQLIGHSPEKSPILSGSFAERDLHKTFYEHIRESYSPGFTQKSYYNL